MEHTFTRPTDSTITIGKTTFKLAYGENWDYSTIQQYTYKFSFGPEIEFYNRKETEVNTLDQSLVAIWHLKFKH